MSFLKVKVKDIPEKQRPRERLMLFGPEYLSNQELLAIILGIGSKKENVIDMSTRILSQGNLFELSQKNVGFFTKTLGVGIAKACKIVSIFELAKRTNSFENLERIFVKSSKDIASIMIPKLSNLKKEEIHVILLNTKQEILKTSKVFTGSLNKSLIHPREIYKVALEESAAKIILVHNHPSGDPTPSQADFKITERISIAGEILDIELLDHIIIGDNDHYSFRENDQL